MLLNHGRRWSLVSLVALSAGGASAQFELFVTEMPSFDSQEFNELFGKTATAEMSEINLLGPMVYDNGLSLRDPIDPMFSIPFASIINSTTGGGTEKTRYFSPRVEGISLGITYDTGETINIEGDPTVTIELFDQIDLGGGMGFVDFGTLSFAFENDDLQTSGLIIPDFDGGLNFLFSLRFGESAFFKDPNTDQIEPTNFGFFGFDASSLFIGEVNNFNNTYVDFENPIFGLICLPPLEEPCLADVNMNGEVEPTDFGAWLDAYNNGDLAADQNLDGQITPTDFGAWLMNYNAGCD